MAFCRQAHKHPKYSQPNNSWAESLTEKCGAGRKTRTLRAGLQAASGLRRTIGNVARTKKASAGEKGVNRQNQVAGRLRFDNVALSAGVADFSDERIGLVHGEDEY